MSEPPIGDHGITPAGDRGHASYAFAKLAKQIELHSIRNPIDWRNELDRWANRIELHDAFVYGRQALLGRTPEDGWEYEKVIHTPYGDRRLDAAVFIREPGKPLRVLESNEYKAGWTPPEETLQQLRKEEWLLRRGLAGTSALTVRSIEDLPEEVLEKAHQLEQMFPGRFALEIVGPEEFERAVAAGRVIVQQRALARMMDAIELVRHAPELEVARDAITRFAQEISTARQAGQSIPLRVLIQAREDLHELVRADARIAHERDDIALRREQIPIRQALLIEKFQAQSREERHQRLIGGLEPVYREIDRAATEVAEHARPDQSRDRTQLLNKARVLEQETPQLSDSDLVRRQREVEYRLEMIRSIERDAERDALQREGLQPDHIEEIQKGLDRGRDDRDQAIIRGIDRAKSETRQRTNEREMARIIDEHNAAVRRVTDTSLAKIRDPHGHSRQAWQAGRPAPGEVARDVSEEARHAAAEEVRRAAGALALRREQAREMDPRLYTAFKTGAATFDAQTQRWIVSIDGREVRVPMDQPERIAAEVARLAERNYDPRAIVHMAKTVPAQPPPRAPELAEHERQEAEAVRAREREAREREARGRGREV
ncbi:hypothetical protein [Nocardia sp. CC227C]|uniref:hypothetical protein n=1 Tax=Nocardia sp. CC227C TaxID=3044562 RepID=UPI00278BC61E|nr:hypothetical protein [Nocardia sp. CC227C]